MNDTLIVIILIFVFVMGFLINLLKNDNNIKESIDKYIDELSHQYDKVILLGHESDGNINYVTFNNTKKEILVKLKGVDNIIKYDDILRVELIKNGKTTMSVSNILLGGVLAGGAGLIAGSLAKNEKITSFHLKFSLNNFNNPSYEIYLLDVGKTVNYKIDIETQANKIMDTVKYIIENK